jgi:hypothetical protein
MIIIIYICTLNTKTWANKIDYYFYYHLLFNQNPKA